VKVLALDFGRARTGVAVSDPSGTIARPLCVVERASSADGLARIAALIGEHQVERVVVGLPLTLRGERGEQARETEIFVETLTDSVAVRYVLTTSRHAAAGPSAGSAVVAKTGSASGSVAK